MKPLAAESKDVRPTPIGSMRKPTSQTGPLYHAPVEDLESNGYALADISLATHQCVHISSSLPTLMGGSRGGVRHLINHPTVLTLLAHQLLAKYLWSVIGRDLVAVKATLFDKTAEANWRVQWHQDRSVAVKERLHVSGFGPWSTKSGLPHVEPPESVLKQMLAVRIHLDSCGEENGPLRVVAGSHRFGKVSEEQLTQIVENGPIVELYVPQGGILLMRPLLVHSSSVAIAPVHRRVLHVEFAPVEAISPLQWHDAVVLHRAA
jgi:hypothetical protein